jgi:hypothetical protein
MRIASEFAGWLLKSAGQPFQDWWSGNGHDIAIGHGCAGASQGMGRLWLEVPLLPGYFSAIAQGL